MKRLIPLTAALSVGLLMPQTASAQYVSSDCYGGTLVTCVDFQLSSTGGTGYSLIVSFVDPAPLETLGGVLTRIGMYYTLDANYSFTNLAIFAPDGKSWSTDGTCVAGDGVGGNLFTACADADPPPTTNGLIFGESVMFTFNSEINVLDGTNLADGFGIRAHIQDYGNCSLRVDSETGLFGTWTDANIDECGTVTVPEPVSLFLLGSGLLGVGGVAMRRRRNGLEVENA
jgi:hypothetical protein